MLRIRQVLINLITNALRFTNKGSIDIKTSLIPDQEISKLK